MIVAFLAIATFGGLILGLRFSVFILVPAILLAIAVIAPIDMATRQSAGMILVTVFATAALLQIGYVVGRVLRVAAETRAPAWLTRSRLFKLDLTNQSGEQRTDQFVDDLDSQSDVLGHGDLPANRQDAAGRDGLTQNESPPIFDAEEEATNFDRVPSAGKRLRK